MLQLEDTFNKELPKDPIEQNTRRQVLGACFSSAIPRVPADPSLIHVSKEMLLELGITLEQGMSETFVNIFSGAKLLPESEPYAMCYGGHQFGHWAGQLGDGRAINIGEIIKDNQRWALQLKGSGETPYSRSADGLAVLRSSVREHLCSEAMYHLGVPTTRSLSLCLTGDEVLRDVMYDGHPAKEKGAVVCRVAPSFIRFGNFQIFSARKDVDNLKKLADYTIKYFFPEVTTDGPDKYLAFFEAVMDRTLKMVVGWQRVGFVHGVMNTDNMSILGLTIDYGPYGWLEGYDNNWTPNTTDRQNKRYRYGHQPAVAHWNLYQLANALFSLIREAKPLELALEDYKTKFLKANTQMMASKLGLTATENPDQDLISSLDENLELIETDMTIFYRQLSELKKGNSVAESLSHVKPAFYNGNLLNAEVKNKWEIWLQRYLKRLQQDETSDSERQKSMKLVNPKYVLRNYMAQLAIDKADEGDYNLIDELYQLLKQPYSEQPEYQKWYAKRPEWARNKVGCSMLSCSS